MIICPTHSSPKLIWLEPGHPASDYSCPQCKFWYQLKSQKTRLGDNITDGAYDAMMNAIRRDELPSMYFMQYEISGRDASPRRPRNGRAALPRSLAEQQLGPTSETIWTVCNLLLVPHFAFPPSAIIKRKQVSFCPETRLLCGAFADEKRLVAVSSPCRLGRMQF